MMFAWALALRAINQPYDFEQEICLVRPRTSQLVRLRRSHTNRSEKQDLTFAENAKVGKAVIQFQKSKISLVGRLCSGWSHWLT